MKRTVKLKKPGQWQSWGVTNSLGGRKQWPCGLEQGPLARTVDDKELLGKLQMQWNKAELERWEGWV